MKFGICAGTDIISNAKKYGMDYFESSVVGLNSLTEDEFNLFLKNQQESPIKCEVLNILFPGSISIVGPNADKQEIKNYLNSSLERASRAEVEIIVFGSGRSRFLPDGFSFETAMQQLYEISYLLGETAKKYGLMIAFEPLNRNETNMINTLDEGLSLVNTVSHPNFKLLADIYHMMVNNESADSILRCKNNLIHVHIATKNGRKYPQYCNRNEYDDFFRALKEIEYDARMSVEAITDNMQEDAKAAIDFLKGLENA